MRVFNLAEELEKERKKNKELEEKLKLAKEQDLYGIKIVANGEQYEAYKGTLQDQIKELQDEIDFLIDRNDKKQEVIDKIKEIFKDYGVKEDIVGYSMYQITGEEVYTILELLEK